MTSTSLRGSTFANSARPNFPIRRRSTRTGHDLRPHASSSQLTAQPHLGDVPARCQRNPKIVPRPSAAEEYSFAEQVEACASIHLPL